MQRWANEFDLLAKLGRGRNEIEQVLIFSQEDKFWACHILEPKNLVKHFTRLKQFMLKRENDIKIACLTYEQVYRATQKYNRQWDEFIYCQDKHNNKFYWDTKKGDCPYEKAKVDIMAYIRKLNDKTNTVYTWNITQRGAKLIEGYYYNSICQGKEEYENSGLNLKFYNNDFEYDLYENGVVRTI
jgi:hypothetical protein